MTFDLIIRSGRVVDGTGTAAKAADVGVTGDRITAIDDLSGASAAREIDASGCVVAPGFIDAMRIPMPICCLNPMRRANSRRASPPK